MLLHANDTVGFGTNENDFQNNLDMFFFILRIMALTMLQLKLCFLVIDMSN